MKIFILGLAHGVQTAGGAGSTAQKSEYRKFLNQLITERSVEFIGEEVSPGSVTIASELANSLGIPWEPIDMSDPEKQELGVPTKWGTMPRHMGPEACTQLTEEGYQRNLRNGWVEIEARHLTDDARDEFMFDHVISSACNAKSVLLLCGYNHVFTTRTEIPSGGPRGRLGRSL
jgi:hypothetical protein